MRLDLESLKQITYGAVRIEEEGDAFYFHRMTKEQVEYYDKKEPDWGLKARSTAGIKLRFKTNSRFLKLNVNVNSFNYVKYFSFDVYVNGKYLDALKNFDENNVPEFYPTYAYELGDFEKSFDLGEGEKTVYVYFPWNQNIKVYGVYLDDGAFFNPVGYNGKALTYGDSITQGYYTLFSAKRYATQLTENYNLEEYCKAIGAETFSPDFLDIKEDITPDLITVAYGSNDWHKKSKEDFISDATGFISRLASLYKNVKIVVISPIWRADSVEEKAVNFEEIPSILNEIASRYENVYFVNARNFVPEQSSYYGDYRLHPNDEGFNKYFEGLKQEFDKVL